MNLGKQFKRSRYRKQARDRRIYDLRLVGANITITTFLQNLSNLKHKAGIHEPILVCAPIWRANHIRPSFSIAEVPVRVLNWAALSLFSTLQLLVECSIYLESEGHKELVA
ncbi:MAG: hypothetical protein WA323_21435 [Candidatus Nitrosopolaris sp.]